MAARNGPVVTSSRETLDNRRSEADLQDDGHRNAVYYLQQPPSRDMSTASSGTGGRGRANMSHVAYQPDPNSAKNVPDTVHIKVPEDLLLRVAIILLVFAGLLFVCGILEASLGVIEPFHTAIWCSVFIVITGTLAIATAILSKRMLAIITLALCVVTLLLILVGLGLSGYVLYWYDVMKVFCVDSRRDERYYRLSDADKHRLIGQCIVDRSVPIIAFIAFYIVDVVCLIVCFVILLIIVGTLLKAFRAKK